MESSPYQPPETCESLTVEHQVRVSTTRLALSFGLAFVIVSAGTHFAIFWGTHDFFYWRLRHYLPTSLVLESLLILLAAILAPIAAWRFPASPLIRPAPPRGMLLAPSGLNLGMFAILRIVRLPEEKPLILMCLILVSLHVFAVAYASHKMIGGWRLTAGLTFVGGTAGVAAGLFHIMISSLVT